jgi:N-formylmaleamate deformylase
MPDVSQDRGASAPAGHSQPFIQGRVRTPAVDIAHLRRPGTGSTLVGLHGLFGSGGCLLPLADALRADVDIVLPDARGHGHTDAPEHGYLYPDLARDVIELVSGLALRHPVLLGHSMGGMTACVAAAEMSKELGGLILIDPTFLAPDYQREVFESGVARDHMEQLKRSRQDMLTSAAARSPDRPSKLREVLVDARLRTHVRAVEVLTPPNPDYRALMKSVAIPTLLITGSKGIVSAQTAEELRRINPAIVHKRLQGTGHGMPYDAPEALAPLISRFLEEYTVSKSL